METIFWRVAQALDAVSVANTEGREKRLRFPFYVNASSEIATATELNLVLESDWRKCGLQSVRSEVRSYKMNETLGPNWLVLW